MTGAAARTTSLPRLVSLWGPVLAYMAAIFSVSAMPTPPLPEQVSDKTAHLAAYWLLGLLAVRAVGRGLPCRVTPRVAAVAILITSGYGALDELHQWFVPGRTADLADWYADSAGAAIAVVACWAWSMIAYRSDG